jgi:hypothetical protein
MFRSGPFVARYEYAIYRYSQENLHANASREFLGESALP